MSWGAVPVGDGRARFRLWAPACAAVTLELGDGRAEVMAALDDGWHAVETAARAGDRYRYRVAPDLVVPDPAARAQDTDVHGWSRLVDLAALRFEERDWRGRPWEETVLYELHPGVLGRFDGVAAALPELAALGVTAVELMPVNAVSGTRNWGYDGVLPYAPADAYGGPEQLAALVDRAHALGLSIFLDVVYNHFGPDGNYLPSYAPGFFRDDVETPWGAGIDFRREAVQRFFIDNAVMWVRDYRVDGLRLDAVHAIGDAAFLDRLAAEVRAAAPGRHVHLVLENEANDAARLAPGGYDAQWNDDFHNVLHVLLTGERHAYYQDFAERPAERLARCLAEGFVYQGEGSPNHDGRPRGTPSAHLPPTRFVSFLQNHDQVGNRALGERLTRLVTPDRLRAATALMLLCPQIPLLFMGEETGSTAPFLFFTDFHDALADAVREGRRREFAKFPAFADPAARARIPDPNDPATFAASQPEPGPDAAAWRAFYAELLALRHARIVPGLAQARAIGATAIGPAAVRASWRLGAEVLTIALNLGDEAVATDGLPQHPPLYALGEPGAPASLAAWLA